MCRWCKHGTQFGPLITTFRHNHGHTSKIEVTYKRPAFSQLFSTSLVFVRLPSPLIPSLSLFPIQDTLYLFYLCHLSVTRFPSGPGSHFFLNNVYVIFINVNVNVNVTWPILQIFLKSFRTSIGNSPTVNQHLPHCQQRPPHPNWQAPAANPKES